MCSPGREKANVSGIHSNSAFILSGDFDVCCGDFSVVTSMVVTLCPGLQVIDGVLVYLLRMAGSPGIV